MMTTMKSNRALGDVAAAHLRLRWDVASALSVIRTGRVDQGVRHLDKALRRAEARHTGAKLDELSGEFHGGDLVPLAAPGDDMA
jgi:hypothetical protein